jgi:lipoprotein-releasing system permease protein
MYRTFLSLRYLRSRFVNLISVAGVMVGVAVLIVVTSVMDGFQSKVREVLRGTLSHLLLFPDPENEPPYEELDAQLKRVEPRVRATAPHVSWYVFHPLKPGGARPGQTILNFLPLEAVGIDWDREIRVSEMGHYLLDATDKAKPFYHPRAVERERGCCLVSRAYVETYWGKQTRNADVIGSNLEVIVPREATDPTTHDFTVTSDTYQLVISGVYDAVNQQSDVGRILTDRQVLRRMTKLKAEYTEVRIALDDYANAPVARDVLIKAFGNMSIQTWEDVQAQFLKAVNNEKVLLLVVLSFVVLLGGFTILATLTLTVVEKTRDIGLVKAIGGTTGGILSIFLRSGLLIGTLGGMLGLGLGVFVANHVNWIKDRLADMGVNVFPPDLYLFREIPTEIVPTTVAGIVVGSILLSFLAGLPPALRGARMDPVEALRYE